MSTTPAPVRFSRSTNRGTRACEGCGVLTWESRTREGNGWACRPCYEAAGLENEHVDGYHPAPVKGCPVCFPEAEARRLAAATARVATYAVSAQKKAQAQAQAERDAAKPHCPNCRAERPRTKATDRGEQVLCSWCKDLTDGAKYFRSVDREDLALQNEAKLAARAAQRQ